MTQLRAFMQAALKNCIASNRVRSVESQEREESLPWLTTPTIFTLVKLIRLSKDQFSIWMPFALDRETVIYMRAIR
jgi:hypothetical protein